MKMFWSRVPGKFVDKRTGEEFQEEGISFSGSVREWYETLIETVVNMKDALRLTACSLSVGASANVIFECSVLYHPVLNANKIGEGELQLYTTNGYPYTIAVSLNDELDDMKIFMWNAHELVGEIIIVG